VLVDLKDAKYGVEFLLSETIDEAKIKLEELKELNSKRKDIENRITDEAMSRADLNDNILIIAGDNWHEGVIGIVASRVARAYKRPVIILTKIAGNRYKGSGRSFTDCNIFQIVNGSRELLERFGGHNSALGLTIKDENLDRFREEINRRFIDENYSSKFIDRDIIGEIEVRSIGFSLYEIIKRYEPFGEGNRRPKFIAKGVTIERVEFLGRGGEHQKLLFNQNGTSIYGLLFRDRREFRIGEVVDITFTYMRTPSMEGVE